MKISEHKNKQATPIFEDTLILHVELSGKGLAEIYGLSGWRKKNDYLGPVKLGNTFWQICKKIQRRSNDPPAKRAAIISVPNFERLEENAVTVIIKSLLTKTRN